MDGTLELERRLFAEAPGLEVKKDENGRTVIRGYAAVFESESQDLGGFVEIVERGAFDEVMRTNPDVFGKYNHERVIGRTSSGTMRLFVDERGLRYEIDPPRAAEDVVELIERGDVRGSSFAFRVKGENEKWERDGKGRQVRRIRSFSSLHDAGPVDQPAYLATETYVSKRALEIAREQRKNCPVVEDSAVPAEERAAAVMYQMGDFVAWDGGVGRIEHIMEEGSLGEYSAEPLVAAPDDPAVLVKKYDHEDGYWEESDHYVAKKMSELVSASNIMGEMPAMIDTDERAVSLRPTAGMAAAAKRGLRLHEEGKSGDGLKPETVARANKLARREEMNEDWVREMNAWFARHESASKSPGWDTPGSEKPGFVAWLLWGGTPAKNWAARKVAQMDAERSASEPVEERHIEVQVSVDTTDFAGKIAGLKAELLRTQLRASRRAQ